MESGKSDVNDMENEKDSEVGEDVEFIKPNIITIKSKNIKKPIQDIENNQKTEPILKVEKSPAEIKIENSLQVPYKEPSWSGLPPPDYKFEVIKGGIVFENIPLIKPFTVIGRSENCDIRLEHPSISRYHSIIQYKAESADKKSMGGMYIYDLGSTHGTFLNKIKVNPNCHWKVNPGYMVKFGGSTRFFLLQGPEAEEIIDEDSATKTNSNDKEKMESEGIDWGMGDDAEIENIDEDLGQNEFSISEELELDDPKKTLKGYFEREGFPEPEYITAEVSPGIFSCKVEVPINDHFLWCSIEHKGKKKEVIVQCALEACKIADKFNLLRQTNQEGQSVKRKNKMIENDFYESDDDEYLDRTGDIERKRKIRKLNSQGSLDVETYDSLKEKYTEVLQKLDDIELKINTANEVKAKQSLDSDDLDDYMSEIENRTADRHKLVEWKLEVNKLDKEESRLRVLLNIAKPHYVSEYEPRKYCSKSKVIPENPSKSIAKIYHKNFSVHKAFLDDDDEHKVKLSKLDDGADDIKSVPYTKTENQLSRYQTSTKISDKKISLITTNKNILPTTSASSKYSTENKKLPNIEDIKDIIQTNSLDNNKPYQNEVKPETDVVTQQEKKFEFLKPFIPKIAPAVKKQIQTKVIEKEHETWTPPVGQSGDGRTSLNDKFGY